MLLNDVIQKLLSPLIGIELVLIYYLFLLIRVVLLIKLHPLLGQEIRQLHM